MNRAPCVPSVVGNVSLLARTIGYLLAVAVATPAFAQGAMCRTERDAACECVHNDHATQIASSSAKGTTCPCCVRSRTDLPAASLPAQNSTAIRSVVAPQCEFVLLGSTEGNRHGPVLAARQQAPPATPLYLSIRTLLI